MLSEQITQQINSELIKYPDRQSVLLPALHIVQGEYGWISQESMADIADLLELQPIEVLEVVSFYTMFNMQPVGQVHLQVCQNISCSLLDSRHLVNFLEEKLKIKVGDTTPDGKYTLSQVECLGYCGTAPAMMINDVIVDSLTEEMIDSLLGKS